MKKKWTRREFAHASLAGAAVVGGHALGGIGLPSPQLAPDPRELLRAAADEIIPETDGMPAPSGVGVLEYLDGVFAQYPEIDRQFQSGLPSLETISQRRFGSGFLSISPAQRVEAMAELETSNADFFAVLRDFVYEGYYLQPAVWKLIGYEFYPSRAPVPPMNPLDEAVLEKVAARPKLYRPVE